MTNYNNDDLYQMLLHRLRKDRKGSVSPEEFESFLRWRNLDYFRQQLGGESGTKINHESLIPMLVTQEVQLITSLQGEYCVSLVTKPVAVTTTLDGGVYLTFDLAHIVNLWYVPTASMTQNQQSGAYTIGANAKVPIDLVSSAELWERYDNKITGPSATYPMAYQENTVLWVFGPTSGYIVIDYYTYPADPYYDYYTDASANVTYLTDGQASYTLLAGQQSRDGKVAGQAVTSASEDLWWKDEDALHILDMIVSDVSIALSDPDSLQASMLERQQNISS